MTLESLRAFFGWCTLINWAMLMIWWVTFSVARDWLHRTHSRWFRLPEETFDAIHYKAMATFKLGVFLFNLAPYLALRIIG